MLKLMAITNDPQKARAFTDAGVQRIFVDLEIHGKHERQPGGNTVISQHAYEDIVAIREALPNTEILVRTNPIHTDTQSEVDTVIQNGADTLMLPMFKTPDDVKRFSGAIAGRAKVCLLVETPQALVRLPTYLEAGIDEIYIGLNDLHLGMQLNFMFEPLAGGVIEFAAKQILSAGIPFGFGGIGCIGSGDIPAEMILAEHIRLGSSMVILSRTFTTAASGHIATEVDKFRACEKEIHAWSAAQFESNRASLAAKIWQKAFSQ